MNLKGMEVGMEGKNRPFIKTRGTKRSHEQITLWLFTHQDAVDIGILRRIEEEIKRQRKTETSREKKKSKVAAMSL